MQKLKQIFEKRIRPELGQIQKKEKYLKVILQLAENSRANSGKGIRESQLTDDVKPATHVLNKLAKKDFVEITLPIGDGSLIVDPINNRRELFKKQEMIEKYYINFRNHLDKKILVKHMAMDILHLTEEEFDYWISSLEEQSNFIEYNKVVFGFLEKGIEIRNEGYGPLLWRKMAKYYNISEKTKQMLEE